MKDVWRSSLTADEVYALNEAERQLSLLKAWRKEPSDIRRALYLKAKKRMARAHKVVDSVAEAH